MKNNIVKGLKTSRAVALLCSASSKFKKSLPSDINPVLNQYNKFGQTNFTYDKNGNTTQKGDWQYTYDYKNKIVRATNGNKTILFQYDPFGRRIRKQTDSNTTNYYYSGDQVIEERNENDKVLNQYIYGNLIDEPIRMDNYNLSTNQINNSYYYHPDSIGNITAITDKDGKLIERYKYDLYGLPQIFNDTGASIDQSSIGNPYFFQSRRYDKELELYYYRARTYDPETGRFLQTDPMGYKDSMNLYQAFNMNGWNYIDPWGLVDGPFSWNGKPIGLLIPTNTWRATSIAVQAALGGNYTRFEIVYYETQCKKCLKLTLNYGGVTQAASVFIGINKSFGLLENNEKIGNNIFFGWTEGIRAAAYSINLGENSSVGFGFDLGFSLSYTPIEMGSGLSFILWEKCF